MKHTTLSQAQAPTAQLTTLLQKVAAPRSVQTSACWIRNWECRVLSDGLCTTTAQKSGHCNVADARPESCRRMSNRDHSDDVQTARAAARGERGRRVQRNAVKHARRAHRINARRSCAHPDGRRRGAGVLYHQCGERQTVTYEARRSTQIQHLPGDHVYKAILRGQKVPEHLMSHSGPQGPVVDRCERRENVTSQQSRQSH